MQQAERIGVLRVGVQLLDRRIFDDEAGIHHQHSLRQARDHPEIMGDPDDGHAQLIAQALDQIDDLGLDGDIQGGRRFVGYQDLWVAGQGHRNHHSLAHTPGELVRVIRQPFRGLGYANHFQQLDRPLTGLRFGHAQVHPQLFGNLVLDGQYRIKRRHRILENHGDLRAAHPADFIRRHLEQVAVREQGAAAFDLPGRLGHQLEHGEHGDAFATAAFSHHSQGLTFLELKAHPVDRVDHAFRRVKVSNQVVDSQDWILARLRRHAGLGSCRSRAARPLLRERASGDGWGDRFQSKHPIDSLIVELWSEHIAQRLAVYKSLQIVAK